MGGGSTTDFPKYEYFNVTLPVEYVAHVEINRQNKLNAWIEAMWLEFKKVIDHLAVSPLVRAIVISGAGPRAFTSGLDVQAAASSPTSPVNSGNQNKSPDGARQAFPMQRHILEFQSCISSVEHCHKPVAVVMHGYCFGLAIDLSTACDVRFASSDAKMCVKEVDIGLAADIGTLARLPKVVGNQGWVKDVCLSARIFGAEEAYKVGFVNGVSEGKEKTVQRAVEWAALVASKSPVAVQGTKVNINYGREHTTEESLRFMSVWNGSMLQSSDVPEAMSAGMQKRKPTFEKL